MIIYLNVSEKFVKKEKIDFSKFEKEIDSVNAISQIQDNKLGTPDQEKNTLVKSASLNKEIVSERFNFDPNNFPEADWKRLGLSAYQIKIIKNYESKGGTFRKKEDVKKMYCIKEDQYSSLEPYIKIPAENKPISKVEESKIVAADPISKSPVELNSADSATLTTIKGIGPFYAKTILKYRNSLGGFYDKKQLMEVWKFDQEKFDGVEKYITVNASKIKRININNCETDQLKIPYLKWNQANAIVSYRKQHGKFKTIDEIKLTDLVDDETLRKIAPYLILE
jgi:DNA uptake protein ComE-like DNA-binding protein